MITTVLAVVTFGSIIILNYLYTKKIKRLNNDYYELTRNNEIHKSIIDSKIEQTILYEFINTLNNQKYKCIISGGNVLNIFSIENKDVRNTERIRTLYNYNNKITYYNEYKNPYPRFNIDFDQTITTEEILNILKGFDNVKF